MHSRRQRSCVASSDVDERVSSNGTPIPGGLMSVASDDAPVALFTGSKKATPELCVPPPVPPVHSGGWVKADPSGILMPVTTLPATPRAGVPR